MAAAPHYLASALLPLSPNDRERIERALVETARAAALGDLAADIGHDLANPLFAVMGLVDLLLMDAEPGTPAAEHLELVRRTSLELRDDLRLLLDFARPPDGAPPAELDRAARLAVKLVCHGRGKELQVSARYPELPVIVGCSPGTAAQAALHLVAAARAHAGDNGQIALDVTSDGASGTLRVSPVTAGGIGLVAAGRIALDHGGSLDLDGTEAVLGLPRSAATP